ncbi:hypothetical protein FBU30_007305 [Linnemannia zychae]|nr:hypothetical protein FBU30_007305 [Linnemannia zychae]
MQPTSTDADHATTTEGGMQGTGQDENGAHAPDQSEAQRSNQDEAQSSIQDNTRDSQDMTDEQNSKDDTRAVARLRFFQFRNEPEKVFYLFQGLNFAGRDPQQCPSIFLKDDFISRCHLCFDADDSFIRIRVLPKNAQPSYIGTGKKMDPSTWYELPEGRKVKLAGLYLFHLEKMTEEERNAAPRKGYTTGDAKREMNNPYFRRETYVAPGSISRSNSRVDQSNIEVDLRINQVNSENNNNTNQENEMRPVPLAYESHTGSEHSYDSTQKIEELTQLVHEGMPRLRSNVSLPPPMTIKGLAPDITVPRPITPSQVGWPGESSADPEKVSNRYKFYDDLKEEGLDNDPSHEPTMFVDEQDISQASIALSEIQSTQPIPVLPDAMLTQVLPSSLDQSLEDDNQHNVIDTDGHAQGPRSKSRASISPESSQQDFIPSTPIEEIRQTIKAVESVQEQAKIEEEGEEEIDRVPQTPDNKDHEEDSQYKQQTAILKESVLETNQFSGSIPDSQATQEAIGLNISSNEQSHRQQDEKEDEGIFKIKESNLEHPLLYGTDSQDISLTSSGAEKENDDEGFGMDINLRPMLGFGNEVCPDSQHSTQPFNRDSSKDDLQGTISTSAIIATVQPRESFPTTEAQNSSQESDRTVSREGSPKHNLEIDPIVEVIQSNPTKRVRNNKGDVATVATSRPNRVTTRANSTDIPTIRRETPMRVARTLTTEGALSVMMSIHGTNNQIDKDSMKVQLTTLKGVTFNDTAYKDASILIYKPGKAGGKTCKLMCAIARGIPIVTTKWLRESHNRRHLVPTDQYLYQDEYEESGQKINLQEACAKGRNNMLNGVYIFEPYEFYCVTKPGIKKEEDGYLTPSFAETNLAPMVEICGGRMITELNPKKKNETIIIASGTSNPEIQSYIAEGYKVMDKDFVTGSIFLQRKDLDFTTHAIPAQSPDEIEMQSRGSVLDQWDTTSSPASSERMPTLGRKPSKIRAQRSRSSTETSPSPSPSASTSIATTLTTTNSRKKTSKKK